MSNCQHGTEWNECATCRIEMEERIAIKMESGMIEEKAIHQAIAEHNAMMWRLRDEAVRNHKGGA